MKLNIQLFAESQVVFENTDGKMRGKLWVESSLNEDGKGSTVILTLYVKRTDSSTTTGHFRYNLNIDGTTWSDSTKLSVSSSYKQVAQKSLSINYNGAYSCYVYGKLQGPTETSLETKKVEGSINYTLDSTYYPATLNSVNIDNFVSQGKFTPYFTVNQSGLYYGMAIIAYSPLELIVSWNSPVAVSTSGAEYTIPSTALQTLWNYLDNQTNRTAVHIKFVLYSFTDSARTDNVGGTDVSFENVIKIPAYSLNWDWNTTTTEDLNRNNQYGGQALSYYSGNKYVKGLSKPRVYFRATSSTGYTYGKTITYTVNGVARNSPFDDSSWNGGTTYTLTASDGRASTSTTITLSVVDYFAPYLSNIKVARPIPTGEKVKISYTVNYYNGSGLSNLTNAVYNFYWRESESASWTKATTLSGSGTSGSATFSNVELSGKNYKKPFYYKIEFTDRIGNTTAVYPYIANIPKGLPVWNGYTDSNDKNVFNINGYLTFTDDSGNIIPIEVEVVDTW